MADYYRPQRSWGKVIFSEACVKNSVHGGGMCGGGACGRRGACMAEGACMARGACVVGCVAGGHAWQGGMHSGVGHVRGACMTDTTRYGQ